VNLRSLVTAVGPGGTHVTNYGFTEFAHYIGDRVNAILAGTAKTLESVELFDYGTKPNTSATEPVTKWMEATELGLEGMGWPSEPPAYATCTSSSVRHLGSI
jgi:hypothetical protein